MILPLLFNPALWGHIGHHHAKALMTPISFETLDRIPEKSSADPPVEEDAMAVQKTAA